METSVSARKEMNAGTIATLALLGLVASVGCQDMSMSKPAAKAEKPMAAKETPTAPATMPSNMSTNPMPAMPMAHSDKPMVTTEPPTAPATMPGNMATNPMPAMPVEKPAVPPTPPPAMTHTLTMSEPYFTSYPATGAAPAGTFASGTKVLVMVPGSMYSKVMTEAGVTAYTGTKGLEPISNK